MREGFQSELCALRAQLVAMCEQAAEALHSANAAVIGADLRVATAVIEGDVRLDAARDRCDETAQRLLALQAPVAGDLRLVLTAVRCADKIERMGDLAVHVAETARNVHPDCVVPPDLAGVFREMSGTAATMADTLVGIIRDPGPTCTQALTELDLVVDARHVDILTAVTTPSWPHGIPKATSLALLARFYERYADQAVAIAKRVQFAVTGVMAA